MDLLFYNYSRIFTTFQCVILIFLCIFYHFRQLWHKNTAKLLNLHIILRVLLYLCIIIQYRWCWGQKVFCPLWYTDCFAFHAPAILKTFEIRPIRATFSCFTGPKVMLFHASMKRITFWPWYHHKKYKKPLDF